MCIWLVILPAEMLKSLSLMEYKQLMARRCALSRGATRSEKSTPVALSSPDRVLLTSHAARFELLTSNSSEDTVPGTHFILSNT